MKRHCRLLLTAVSLGLSVIANADDTADIRAVYVKLNEALAAKTPDQARAALSSICTPDFMHYSTDHGGMRLQETLQKLLDDLKQQFATTKQLQEATITPGAISVVGGKATVDSIGLRKCVVTLNGQPGGRTLVITNTEKDAFVKLGGQWKLSSVEEETEKPIIDGKKALKLKWHVLGLASFY